VRPPVPAPAPDLHLHDPTTWPPFLTLTETARILRVSRSSVYELAAAGTIPVVKFAGRSWRVPRGALAALAGERLVGNPAELAADQQEPEGGVSP
jgi:excisionase family DNA binding protein